ncbi:hypothetical protein [Nostoc sp.]|uniref:hypothetical protein n=1 Tax=Nostoc sp. TaxID=1180 RepID=UPI002FF0185F
MPIRQPPDLKQRIKFKGITMPNTIAVSNIADVKTGSQRAAMSTTGYSASRLLLQMKIGFNSTPSSLANQMISDHKPGGEVSTY